MKGRAPAKVEIRCPACGRDAWLAREPKYDGFVRVGERLSCALCAHEFASEAEIPFKEGGGPKVFTEADPPRPVRIFCEDQTAGPCRHVAH